MDKEGLCSHIGTKHIGKLLQKVKKTSLLILKKYQTQQWSAVELRFEKNNTKRTHWKSANITQRSRKKKILGEGCEPQDD